MHFAGEVVRGCLRAGPRACILKLAQLARHDQKVTSQVGISTRTVESHRNNIMHKLQIRAFSDLVRYAVRHKMVPA